MKIFFLLLVSSAIALSQADYSTLLLLTSGSVCTTSDTSELHDTLLEGWQTGSGENTWTNIGDTAKMNIIDTAALTTGKPTGACDKALVVTNGTDGVEAFKLWDNGSAINTSSTGLDVVQYIYVHTAPGSGDIFVVGTANNNVATVTSSPVFDMLLYNNAGNLQIGVGGTAATALYTNISTGTWTKIAIHIDSTPANSYFAVNGGTQINFTNANTSARYFRSGSVSSLDANDTGVYFLDVLCVNTP